MASLDCDFTPMKEALKNDIQHIISALEKSLDKEANQLATQALKGIEITETEMW